MSASDDELLEVADTAALTLIGICALVGEHDSFDDIREIAHRVLDQAFEHMELDDLDLEP